MLFSNIIETFLFQQGVEEQILVRTGNGNIIRQSILQGWSCYLQLLRGAQIVAFAKIVVVFFL
jgi:hypothetical protein